jgi:hypothetical protein
MKTITRIETAWIATPDGDLEVLLGFDANGSLISGIDIEGNRTPITDIERQAYAEWCQKPIDTSNADKIKFAYACGYHE